MGVEATSVHPDPSSSSPEHTLLVQQMFVKEISNLRGSLWPMLPDHHRLDDVIQETFLVVTRKAADFREGTNFRAWIFAIGRNKVLQTLRERRHESLIAPEVLEAITEDLTISDHFEERLQRLRHCVRKLPENGRNMIALRYVHRKSLPEIAHELSLRTASVKVMMSRFRALLRGCIEKQPIHNSGAS